MKTINKSKMAIYIGMVAFFCLLFGSVRSDEAMACHMCGILEKRVSVDGEYGPFFDADECNDESPLATGLVNYQYYLENNTDVTWKIGLWRDDALGILVPTPGPGHPDLKITHPRPGDDRFKDLIDRDVCKDGDSFFLNEVRFTACKKIPDDPYNKCNGDRLCLAKLCEKNPDFDLKDTACVKCPPEDCVGRIGDFVWFDENKDGCQDPGEGIPGVTVCLYEDADCSNPGKGTLVEPCTTTDDSGFYLFDNLECDKDYEVKFIRPDGLVETVPNSCSDPNTNDDTDDSDCVPDERVCVSLDENGDGVAEDLTIDCGYVECDISVDKKCQVEPPATGPFECDDKVDALKMIWNGPGTLQSVVALPGGNDSFPIVNITMENGDQVVTVTDYQPSSNDVIWNWESSSDSGQSQFHLSCSDDEMDGPEDCGNPQGNGKSNEDEFANVWLLDGLATDKGFVFDCTPQPPEPSDQCAFEASPVPGCKTDPEVNDLTSITFRYTGTGCSASNNDQGEIGDKWDCVGEPGADPVDIIVIKDIGKTSSNKDSVSDGDTFTLSDDFSSESIVKVGNQMLTFHTSCSQPLAVGDVFGSLEVVGINGLSPGREVTYSYEVTNNSGTSVVVTSVFDDLLGELFAGSRELDPGESFPLESSEFISETTTNEVTASAGPPGQCEATDTVTVTVEEPTCKVSIELYKIEDKKIKWKLSNMSSIAATIDELTIKWPGSTKLKKVKYDGNDIFKEVLLSSPATITQWLKEPKDRTLKAGDTGKKLELEFDENFPDKKEQNPEDFDLTVTFEQGCGISF